MDIEPINDGSPIDSKLLDDYIAQLENTSSMDEKVKIILELANNYGILACTFLYENY